MLSTIYQHADEIAAVCRRHGVKRLEVFDSAARAMATEAVGDFDFAVSYAELDRNDALGQVIDLKLELEKLLGKAVDLVELHAVRNPYVLKTIDEDKQLVFAA
jgi:predicted nucleotidyltransferase